MDGELKGLLNQHGITQATIDWIQAEGYTSVASFHNWANSAQEVETRIHAKSPDHQRSSVGAALKQVWRVCASRNLAALDKLAKGLPVASNDEPLDYDVQKGIEKNFLQCYNWPELDVDEMGCDSTRAGHDPSKHGAPRV